MPDPSSKAQAFFKQHKVLTWGGIIVLGAGAVIVYRRKAAQQSAQTATTDTGQSNIDPQTGFPVGSPEDEQALQQMSATGYYGTGYDPYAGYGVGPVPVPTGGGGGGSTGGATGHVTTNDQWFIKAQNTLPNGHSAAVETALQRVLGGLTVTWGQRALFLEAVGVLGQPPAGYPKPIRTENAGGDHGGSHRKSAVPNEVGRTYVSAAADLIAHGFKPHHEGRGRLVNGQRPAAGTEARKGTEVVLLSENR